MNHSRGFVAVDAADSVERERGVSTVDRDVVSVDMDGGKTKEKKR